MNHRFWCRPTTSRDPRDILDFLAILFWAASLAAFVFLAPAKSAEVDVTLVLAADVSASMSTESLALQRESYADAFSAEEVQGALRSGPVGAIAVTLLEWSGEGHQTVVVPWTRIDGPEDAARFRALALAAPPSVSRGSTALGEAILAASRLLDTAPYRGRRVIDVSGDGPTNTGTPTAIAIERACDGRTTVNGLPIRGQATSGEQDVVEHYEEHVVCGPGAFLVVAEGMADFRRALHRKLTLEIAGRVPGTVVAGR